MNRRGPMPFGPEHKDTLWRWASFAIGLAGFVVLIWVATLGAVSLFGVRWLMLVVAGGLLSVRAGLAWRRGEARDLGSRTRTVQPTVDIRGQAGSTYLVMEKPRGPRVGPREFSPFWWSLYSLFVRAPVHLGDAVLTAIWRGRPGWINGGSANLARQFDQEQMDRHDRRQGAGQPDGDRF